jgi:ornithine aminotransferase
MAERQAMTQQDQTPVELEQRYAAHNYEPLPVVLTRGRGAYLWDDEDRRYIDMMSAYSAASHGHAHPRILAALHEQAARLSVPSRAYYNDRLGAFAADVCARTGLDAMLPMNTGAEAVETAIKAARRWGYHVKGIPHDQAQIIVAAGNFHGRTTTIVGFSSEADYRDGFGPFTPGFVTVPFGDLEAMQRAITPETAAILIEPIQGEGGINVPPDGYLAALRRLCDAHNVLLILDEVQSGLGRAGAWFAFQHEGIRPDGLILGKALGGGVLPVSAFVARQEVMDVFTPGSHGSTFGGNPLAAAVAIAALRVIEDEGLVERSRALGEHMFARLREMSSPALKARPLGRRRDRSGCCRCARCLPADAAQGRADERHAWHRGAPRAAAGDWQIRSRYRARYPGRGTGRGRACGPAGDGVTMGEMFKEPRILMSPPDFFGVHYAINPWMDPAEWGKDARALAAASQEQWLALHATLSDLGARIELMPPASGLPDLVFTANAAVVMDRKALLARFRYPERSGEEPHIAATFRTLQARDLIDEIATLPEGVGLEGAGDCVFDRTRNMFWLGYGPRSDEDAAPVVEDTFGLDVVPLELVDPRFYHMDTALSVLPRGEVMWVPEAFSAHGRQVISAYVPASQRIAIGEADAVQLCANAVCIGNSLVMSSCSEELRAELLERGYRVVATPLTSFLRSGGSAFCLTLRLDLASEPRLAEAPVRWLEASAIRR